MADHARTTCTRRDRAELAATIAQYLTALIELIGLVHQLLA